MNERESEKFLAIFEEAVTKLKPYWADVIRWKRRGIMRQLDFDQRQAVSDLIPKVAEDAEWAAAEIVGLSVECKQLRVQLAGCGVAASGHVKDLVEKGDYGWSAAYEDVVRLRQLLEAARHRYEVLRTPAEEVYRQPDSPHIWFDQLREALSYEQPDA